VGLFSIIFNFSWIKAIGFVLLLFSGLILLVSQKLRWRMCQRVFKCMLVGALIFTISFSVFEGYLFYNAGYPPTFGSSQYDVALSYPNMLNASMAEIVQSVKNTHAFKLLMLEHPGEVSVERIIFNRDSLEVLLYSESSNLGFMFRASHGNPYRVSIISGHSSLYLRHLKYILQTSDENLQQIDRLGLQWYYDCAIKTYQNETGIIPEINNLTLQINIDNMSGSAGMMIFMHGSYIYENNSQYAFTAYFYPNGTLINFCAL